VASGRTADGAGVETARRARPATAGRLATVLIGATLVDLLPAAGAGATPAADDELAAVVQSLELVAVAVYAEATPLLANPALTATAAAFAQHHRDHATAFAHLAGAKAVERPNAAAMASLSRTLQAVRTQADALALLVSLENHLAATDQAVLEALVSPTAVKVAASIQPVESQHAVVLGLAAGKPVTEVVGRSAVQTRDGAFDVTKDSLG